MLPALLAGAPQPWVVGCTSGKLQVWPQLETALPLQHLECSRLCLEDGWYGWGPVPTAQ